MILSWNTRGTGQPMKKRAIRETIKKSKCQIICLQETKQNQMNQRLQRAICGNKTDGWVSKNATGSAGGLLCCWNKTEYDGKALHTGNYSISVELTCKLTGFSWMISNIYGPHREQERSLLFSELDALRTQNTLPWILIGDFNATRFSADRNTAAASQNTSKQLNKFVNRHSLVEIKLSGRQYTWSNLRDNPVLAKLDRCFTSIEWLQHFPTTNLSALTRSTSDHVPILLQNKIFCKGNCQSLKPFRFENFWLTVAGFEELVKDRWNSGQNSHNPITNIVQKLRLLRSYLKSWNRQHIGNILEQKEQLLQKINYLDLQEESRVLTSTESEERNTAKSELEKILKQEEILWKQRARTQWLHNGDRNTKFFHLWASNRKRKNLITSIQHQQSVITEPESIKECFRAHFKLLLGNSEIPCIAADWKNLYPEGASQLDDLDAPFSEQEIKNAVFQLASNKSPGPDGFPLDFYKRFWHIIKQDLIEVFTCFYHHQTSIDRLNFSFITLIPKKDLDCTVKDYRPISLMNGIVKIISKVLSLRLSTKLDKLIKSSQSAFIKGKTISDVFATASELISHSAQSKQKGIILKLDFEKAFDNVAWPFLFNLLKARGFGERWCRWIEDIITTAKSSVLVNGSMGKSFNHQRGLRQGDPLSPQLFILVVDTLNRILDNASANKLIKGIGNIDILNRFHNLQFADDTLIFSGAHRENITALKFILYSYELMTGLKINFEKSMVIGIGITDNHRNQIAKVLGSRTKDFPFNYLGLPLRSGRLKQQDWVQLIERIAKKLSSWKGKLLSIAGRATLLNSVITPIVSYWMSNFSIPCCIIRRIDKMRRAFLWSGESTTKKIKCLLNWNQVCRPKNLGGMGITNLTILNKVLQCKWWWNLFKSPQNTWNILATALYRHNRPITLTSPQQQQHSEFWKSIQRVKPLFQSLIKFILGDGLNTSFWKDTWLFQTSIEDRFPSLYNLCTTKEISVAEAYIFLQEQGCWPLATPSQYDLGLHHLQQTMHTKAITDKPDTIEWKWFSTTKFSTKQCYLFLQDGGIRPFFSNIFWKIKIPEKIKYFVYLCFLDKIQTKANLVKHGWKGKVNCSLCGSNPETVEHLLLQCTFSRVVWTTLLQNLRLQELPQNQILLWSSWRSDERACNLQPGLDILISATQWALWKERNKRCFEFHAFQQNSVIKHAINLFLLWAEYETDVDSTAIQNLKTSLKTLLGDLQLMSSRI